MSDLVTQSRSEQDLTLGWSQDCSRAGGPRTGRSLYLPHLGGWAEQSAQVHPGSLFRPSESVQRKPGGSRKRPKAGRVRRRGSASVEVS